MRILAFLFFLLFCAFALVARWYYVCNVKELCAEVPAAVEDIRLKNLRLSDGERILLDNYDQFAFDSAQFVPRLNANNEAFLDTLAAIMLADTSQSLTITGYYRLDEGAIAPGFFENLGVARADAVRRLLMQRGIAENRITVDHNQSDDPLLREPISFELYKPMAIPDEFDKVAFTFTNMTFSDANFEFDSDVFRPGEPFKLYADSLKTYLRLNPDKNLTIIGHTDNVGQEKYNLNLGLRRAKSARLYFEELGISSEIEVESMGENRPVAPNQSAAGRQKNRRVNFVIGSPASQ